METNIENQIPEEATSGGRPKLLNVICILSFIWCGLAFVGGIYNIIQNSPEKQADKIEEIRQVMPEMADKMETMFTQIQESTYMQISQYLSLLYALLSFLGVFMMWKLNKKGFYLYLGAELLPYVGFIVATKPMMAAMSGGGMMPWLAPVIVTTMILSDVIFFAMYTSQLKYMKSE